MSTLEAVAQAFAMFGAAYPSARKVDESTVRVWHDGLANYGDDRIRSATKRWIHNEPFFPNLPKFMELVRSESSSAGEQLPRSKPPCGMCENGFIEVDSTGRGTVQRCPNGCLPEPVETHTGTRSRGGDGTGLRNAREILAGLTPYRGTPKQ